MLAERHTVKRAHRFALAARCDDGYPLRRVFFDIRNVDHRAVGNLKIPQLRRRAEEVLHAAPRDGDLPAVFFGSVYYLLHAVYVGGKCRDDNAPFFAAEQPVEADGKRAFARRVAGAFGVGAVAQKQTYPLAPQLRKAGKVDRVFANRGEIHLEIAGVEYPSHRGAYAHGTGIRHGMVHRDKFDFENAGADGVARVHAAELCVSDAVFGELAFDYPDGERSGIYRYAGEFLQKVGHRADVILMPVRDTERAHLFRIAFEV